MDGSTEDEIPILVTHSSESDGQEYPGKTLNEMFVDFKSGATSLLFQVYLRVQCKRDLTLIDLRKGYTFRDVNSALKSRAKNRKE